MDEIVYVCTGSCGAKVSEPQYKAGLIACGDPNCNKRGHLFKKMVKCGKCGQVYEEGQLHQH